MTAKFENHSPRSPKLETEMQEGLISSHNGLINVLSPNRE